MYSIVYTVNFPFFESVSFLTLQLRYIDRTQLLSEFRRRQSASASTVRSSAASRSRICKTLRQCLRILGREGRAPVEEFRSKKEDAYETLKAKYDEYSCDYSRWLRPSHGTGYPETIH